jgi:predicted RNase H-like nuclease
VDAVFTGFDSAWTRGNCGAIAHARLSDGQLTFVPPVIANFDEAAEAIESEGRGVDLHLIGVDQPLIVPNLAGCRPVERAFQPLMGKMRSAILPANRGRFGMFDDGAPIRSFIKRLQAPLDPIQAINATKERFAFEIYPAGALLGLFPEFIDRGRCPKYNPKNRKNFSLIDWNMVCTLVGQHGKEFGILGFAEWCREHADMPRPRKADQDCLDAAICVLVTFTWWKFGLERSLMVGDLDTGYIVTPTNTEMTTKICAAAAVHGVPVATSTR